MNGVVLSATAARLELGHSGHRKLLEAVTRGVLIATAAIYRLTECHLLRLYIFFRNSSKTLFFSPFDSSTSLIICLILPTISSS